MEINYSLYKRPFYSMHKTISAISIVFIASAVIYLLLIKNEKINFQPKKESVFEHLKENNADFKAGADAMKSGDTKKAIEAFILAKNSSQNKTQDIVIQYNVANARMQDNQRYPAIAEYLKINKKLSSLNKKEKKQKRFYAKKRSF